VACVQCYCGKTTFGCASTGEVTLAAYCSVLQLSAVRAARPCVCGKRPGHNATAGQEQFYHHGSRTRAGGRGGGELDKTAGASASAQVAALGPWFQAHLQTARRGRCAGADGAKPRTAKRRPIARWEAALAAASAVLQRPALAVRVICLRAATSTVGWPTCPRRVVALPDTTALAQRCVPPSSWWEERWKAGKAGAT
jgi:hypothetical protein